MMGEENTIRNVGMLGQIIIAFLLPYGITLLAMSLQPLFDTGRVVLQGFLLVLLSMTSVLMRLFRIFVRHMRIFVLAVLEMAFFKPVAVVVAVLSPIKIIAVALFKRFLPSAK